jgi:ATP-dependent DNA ligase
MRDGAAKTPLRTACAMGLEGLVSKRIDSRYKSGRCLSWVKVKNTTYERRVLQKWYKPPTLLLIRA